MSHEDTDEAAAVRAGEEFDAERLARVVARHLPEMSGPLEVLQFPAGHSNLTYLVRSTDREIVLRRPPFGYESIRSGHDMAREYRVLRALEGRFALAPRPLFFCDESESPLGAPFYAMERVRGLILRPGRRAPMRLDALQTHTLALRFAECLAELHAVDATAPGVAELGRPEGYLRRQVDGWIERYSRARTDDVPEMERAAAWLAANLPATHSAALIHNDFKYDNVVLDPADPTRILAVLDWEMATVGDPLADLGTSLAYWIEPCDPEAMRALEFVSLSPEGTPNREQLAALYAAASGRPVGALLFYYLLGVFKVAVIAQQIFARFAAGHTKDPRFAGMRAAVRALGSAGVRAIEAGRVSPGS